MIGLLAFSIIALNVLTVQLLPIWPPIIFLQFVWKDIYILLMFKQLWSMIHSTIHPSKAKYLYGFIFGMGTVSSMLCSQIPSQFAVDLGSASLLYCSVPLYLFMFLSYWMALRHSKMGSYSFATEVPAKATEGFSLIRNSCCLTSVLLLVVFMQVSAALLEYQFNSHLETAFTDQDLRTAYCGKIMGITNLISTCLQFLGGFFLLQWLGLKRGHFLIPFLLCISGICAFAFPTFAMISCCFVLVKALDFSLFGVLREMLYIPLSVEEKYKAKAVIDVFAYRSSKAVISLGILALQLFAGASILSYVNGLAIVLFIAWMGLVIYMFKKPHELLKS
jgi:AAA family ATP:ADP antiporter